MITTPRSLLHLDLAPNGSPRRLSRGRASFDLDVKLALKVGGTEVRGPMGGIVYEGTETLPLASGAAEPTRRSLGMDDQIRVETGAGNWRVDWQHTLRGPEGPGLGVGLDLTPPWEGNRVLRDLVLTIDVVLPEGDWRVEAPGAGLRPSVALRDLPAKLDVPAAGGTAGGSGLVGLTDGTRTLVVWNYCATEAGRITVSRFPGGVRIVHETRLAGEPHRGESMHIEPLQLHVDDGSGDLAGWPAVEAQLPAWYGVLGLHAPDNPPEWARRAAIFEVQLGHSVFWGGHEYGPYPTIAELRADLDRIQAMGFTMLQIMPRQPYPSYNVHDYDDIETSYAPEAELRELVEDCHRRGMHVILDILMHGVMDHAAIDGAVAGVKAGPYADRLEVGGRAFEPDSGDTYPIAWSRHILDFEPHWRGGSPERSPLLDQHPDWFFRYSDGRVAGIYTEAFDVRTSFGDHFIEVCLDLVRRLGIDGFRFDAPTYNDFANWSLATRHRASASVLACLELFRRLRVELRAERDDLLLYTEPSGVLHRESMDLNYNYDEQWLLGAVVQPKATEVGWSVRHAHDLVRWYAARDAALPPGSLTAHHIDSHDTFWWPLWGAKWRREQFGLDATRALAAMTTLLGGPTMTFIGGEEGVDDVLTTMHRLVAERPALAWGEADFVVLAEGQRSVFSVVHRFVDDVAVALVNLSDAPVQAEVTWPEQVDAWTDIAGLSGDSDAAGGVRSVVSLPAWGVRVMVPVE